MAESHPNDADHIRRHQDSRGDMNRGKVLGNNEDIWQASAGDGSGMMGIARKVWMGNEKDGWRDRRMKEEQEAEKEGKGIGSVILDQIWEVWNWEKQDNDTPGNHKPSHEPSHEPSREERKSQEK